MKGRASVKDLYKRGFGEAVEIMRVCMTNWVRRQVFWIEYSEGVEGANCYLALEQPTIPSQ